MLDAKNNFFHNYMNLLDETLLERDYTMMKADISKNEGEYCIEIDLPGVEKENMKIDYHKGYLTVEANRTNEEEIDGEYIRKERYCGMYRRSFYVGDIDITNIKAKYKDGILTIHFPEITEETYTKKQIKID